LLHKKLAAEEFKPVDENGEVEDLSEQDGDEILHLQLQNNIIPKMASALGGLQSQYSSYGPCVRLCRKWLSSHLLDYSQFPPIVTQLLVANLYLSPGEFQVPHTPYIGFIRFLFMLATTDFNITPLFIDIADGIHPVDLKELQARFTYNREFYPAMFIASPYDLRGREVTAEGEDEEGEDMEQMKEQTKSYRYKLASHWTEFGPSQSTLQNVKQIAQKTINEYSDNVANPAFDLSGLFVPSTSSFDVEILLKSKIVGREEESVGFDGRMKEEYLRLAYERKMSSINRMDVHALLNYLEVRV